MVRDPWGEVLRELSSRRRRAEDAVGLPHLEHPLQIPSQEYGDVAFATHPYAREAGKPPQEVAEDLAGAMDVGGLLARHEAQGGFVNSYLAYPAFGERTLSAVLGEGEKYGHAAPSGRRVIVEHSSVNPTGPIHVGRARNSVIGDSLARLLSWSGHDVTREFLVNDTGKQVLTLLWGTEHLDQGELEPPEREKEDHRLVRYYREASERMEDPTVAEEVNALVRRLEEGDEALRLRVREVCQRMLDGILETLRQLDVEFDRFFWEDETIVDGSARRAVEELEASGHAQEEEGALFVDMEPYGIKGRDTRWFFTRKDGTTLYATRDVAYHRDKFRRSDEAINVLGEDQRLAFRQLSTALQLLGEERPVEGVFYAFVGLPEGRLSTRKGRVVNLDDLIDEVRERAYGAVSERRNDLGEEAMRGIARAVALGAIRYNIVRVQPEKKILFRWDEALSLEGQTAPFLQYAYARSSGILRKAEGGGSWDAGALEHPQERSLLKLLARFPSAVRECAANRRPHQMASFAHELATTFNLFYRDCPVLQAEDALRTTRRALVEAFRTVLGNALYTLGVPPLEEM